MSHATDETPDVYGADATRLQSGEEVAYRIDEEGRVVAFQKEPREPASRLSGRQKRAVREADDDTIMARHRSESSGKTYYSVGTGVTVIWYGGGKRPYLCLTCLKNLCVHVERVDRWRGEQFA